MPETIARQLYVGYAKESTRNQPIAVATKFVNYTSYTMDTESKYYDDDSAFGRREGLVDRQITQQMAKGNLEGYLDADGIIGELLHHVYGQSSSVQSGVTGAYIHTFGGVNNNTNVPTFTLQSRRGDEGVLRAIGCGVKSLELDFGDGECKFKSEILAVKEETGDTQTVALTKPSRPLLAKNMTCRYAPTIAGLSSPTSFKINKLNVKIDTGSDFVWDFGSRFPSDVLAKTFTCEVSFSALVRDATFYNYFINNTKTALEFDCNMAGLPVLGTSSLFPRIRFRVPPSTVELTHKNDLDDFIMFDAKIKCEYSFADGFMFQTLLQNTQTNY